RREARAPGHRHRRHRVVRRGRARARERRVGVRGDERREQGRRAARRARGRPHRARVALGAAPPRRAGPRHGAEGGVAHADQDRPARGADRDQGRPPARRQRGRAQGAGRAVRELGAAAAARGEDARHHRQHARHADVLPRGAAVHRHGHRHRRLPELHRGARAARLRLGVRGEPRHGRERGAVGVARGGEAQGEVGGGGALRPHPRPAQPLAHHPRVDRPPHGARPRARLRGQLRRHQLRRAPREGARQAQVRARVHEHPGRPHAARVAGARGVGRRGRAGRPVAHRRQGDVQGLPDYARPGAVHRGAHRRQALARLLVRAELERRAVPAHAEREPDARREGAVARRHRRGHRPGRGREEPRLVVDRPAALQLPVLRPGRLRGAEGEDHRDAQGRRLPEPHPRLLERDGHDRGQGELLARRLVRRRQGRAEPEQLREPRVRARALQEREHREHRAARL
ncbi:MAG: TldD family protein, Actinobacterial subgroup, partial [uncultured Gemmatimonadaceae bacterium]